VTRDSPKASGFRTPSTHELSALRRPLQRLIEGRTERLTPIREAIFNLLRHLVMDDPAHDAISLQLAQLLDLAV
jgi:hypothetical protein